jgi:hypothetical protein
LPLQSYIVEVGVHMNVNNFTHTER